MREAPWGLSFFDLTENTPFDRPEGEGSCAEEFSSFLVDESDSSVMILWHVTEWRSSLKILKISTSLS